MQLTVSKSIPLGQKSACHDVRLAVGRVQIAPMDVHRARFVPFPTSAVSAVAFSRSTDAGQGSQPALKLAIGRQNGSIELWNPLHGQWVQEIVFQGSENKSIDGLVWTRSADEKSAGGEVTLGQHRLFSISGSPAVVEWDLQRGSPKQQSSGNFNEVWCFAAQPRLESARSGDEPAASQDLVAGCADGTLVLLSTADDELSFKRILARVSGKKTRCLSVTYQGRDKIVAGFTDGTIRVYDTKRDTQIRLMSLGPSVPGAPKNTYVWQVKCLPSGDIVSGDSSGNITLWDGKSYSSTQRITAHDTDCLDLVVSADGKTIFSGSIEGRIAAIRKTTSVTGASIWMKQSHRKIHNGDVKCLASYDAKDMSVIVSGGSDMKAVVTPLREYGKASGLTLPHLPQHVALASARHARLLVSWWDKTISIWRVARRPGSNLSPEAPRKLVAKMTLNTKNNLESVSVSEDGRLLAASTRNEVKVFQLRRKLEDDSLAVRKLELPRDLATASSRLISFSPDGKWLANVTLENDVQIVRTATDPANPKRLRILGEVVELERANHQVELQSGFVAYDRTVVRVAFNSDSSTLVVGDISGHLDSWILGGKEDLTAPVVETAAANGKMHEDDDSDSDDSDDEGAIVFFGQRWTDNPNGHLLPRVDSMPLVLSFRPSIESHAVGQLTNGEADTSAIVEDHHPLTNGVSTKSQRLWVMTATHQMYEFDVSSGRSTSWSRRNPTAALPQEFRKLRDRVKGAVWDVTAQRERLWLYGSGWVYMLKVAGDLKRNVGSDEGEQVDGAGSKQIIKKRKGARRESDAVAGKRRRLSQSSRIQHHEGLTGIARRYENGVETEFDLDQAVDDEDMEHETETIIDAARLQLARQANEDEEGQGHNATEASTDRSYWHTLQYRSILGVVPLTDFAIAGSGDPDRERLPEVVIVERPIEIAAK